VEPKLAAAEIDERVDDHRRKEPVGREIDERHHRTRHGCLDRSLSSLIQVQDAEQRHANHRGQRYADVRFEDPQQKSATEEFLADSGGDRQRGEPRELGARVREQILDVVEL